MRKQTEVSSPHVPWSDQKWGPTCPGSMKLTEHV